MEHIPNFWPENQPRLILNWSYKEKRASTYPLDIEGQFNYFTLFRIYLKDSARELIDLVAKEHLCSSASAGVPYEHTWINCRLSCIPSPLEGCHWVILTSEARSVSRSVGPTFTFGMRTAFTAPAHLITAPAQLITASL